MKNALVEAIQETGHKSLLPVPVTQPPQGTVSGGQFLTFSLHDEVYGLDILRVREIISYTRPTAIPMMPDFVRGVINLRGHVVPILDLALRFGWPATDIRVRTCIVVIDVQGLAGSQVVGILVDAVNTVLELDGAEVEPAPKFGTAMHPRFILGMAKMDNAGFITLLDAGCVLSAEDMAALALAGHADAEVVGSDPI